MVSRPKMTTIAACTHQRTAIEIGRSRHVALGPSLCQMYTLDRVEYSKERSSPAHAMTFSFPPVEIRQLGRDMVK